MEIKLISNAGDESFQSGQVSYLYPLICSVAWVRRQPPWWTRHANLCWVCMDSTFAHKLAQS